MSDREKKLVLLFGIAAFLLVNFFGISWFRGYQTGVARDLLKAKASVTDAENKSENHETISDEMEFLAKYDPKPRPAQTVQTELEQFASSQAAANQLQISKRPRFLPTDESGSRFHRAKVELSVKGSEASIYRWLDKLQVKEEFRGLTFMRISPDQDDTLAECTVTAEQWFVPASVEESAPAVETPDSNPIPQE